MDKKYIMALDQGTTSSRTIIFTVYGNIVSVDQKEFTQYFPRPGWVEHEAEEIFESQLETAKNAIKKANINPEEIIAIGITNQRETTIVWDRLTGKPVHRAIVWQDRRTAGICDVLKSKSYEPIVRQKTGLVLDPYFSGTKLTWLFENIDGLKEKAQKGDLAFGTVDSWLIYKLTGGKSHVTDVSNASRTLLFDINTLSWDDELCNMLEVPKSVLPNVKPSASSFGETDPSFFGVSIPITGVAGDQQAALFGQACFKAGMAKNTYGTGAFVVLNTGEKPIIGDGVLTTLAWKIKNEKPNYALEGSIFVAGAAVQWLRDGLKLIDDSPDIENLAKKATDNGGVYFVPALVGLGAPFWDPYARGLIIGITRGTTKAHLARATLESMAYSTKDAIEAMVRATGIPLTELRVDGGASINNILMQFQSDILNVPVLRPRVSETTALGAAYLAGIGADAIDVDTIEKRWELDAQYQPQMKKGERERLYAQWQKAIERSKNWIDA
ncbi:MAG: glycerol kinase GlpK [Desulfurella sp.]|uniref:glycerol kinase GlpK n=1 Tax=Desulfurella sp. TaxID=1962857 RepID=UPI003CB22DDA